MHFQDLSSWLWIPGSITSMLLLSLPDLGSNCARCGSGFDLECVEQRGLLWNHGIRWSLADLEAAKEIKSRTSTAPLSTLRLREFHAKQLTDTSYQNHVKSVATSWCWQVSWRWIFMTRTGEHRKWCIMFKYSAAPLISTMRSRSWSDCCILLQLGAQHSTQCATLRSAPLYKKAQCHTMTRGETTLDYTSKYQQYNVNTSSNCM